MEKGEGTEANPEGNLHIHLAWQMKHRLTKGKRYINDIFQKYIPKFNWRVIPSKAEFGKVVFYCTKEKTRFSLTWKAYPKNYEIFIKDMKNPKKTTPKKDFKRQKSIYDYKPS